MKKLFTLLLSALLIINFFTGCSSNNSSEVNIVYTNDVHSYIDNVIKDKNTQEKIPGLRFSKVSSFVKEKKAEGKVVFLVDAGDIIQGNSYGSFDKGKSIIDIMNIAGYDLAAVGNHEFDYGMENLFSIFKAAKFSFISCNFYKKENGKKYYPVKPYKIFKAGKKKIAFIGISTPESITSSTPAFFQNDKGQFIYFIDGTENPSDLYESVQRSINKIRRKADYVIALGHVGVGEDEIKKHISSIDVIKNTYGLDAFIDGHSHTVVEKSIVQDKNGKDVLLTQTGSYLNKVGLMTISETGNISTELFSDLENVDEQTSECENQLIEKVTSELGKQIAILKNELYISNPEKEKQRLIRSTEMNAGDFVSDSVYWYFNEVRKINCDAVLSNGGGIRTFIKSGAVTKKNLKDVVPFGNMVCLIKATGKQIKDALEMGVTVTGEYDKQWDCPSENGGFMQVAGLHYSIDVSYPTSVKRDEKGMFKSVDGAYRVFDIEIYNRNSGEYEPLKEEKIYYLGGINYILRNGGNGCSMFQGCETVVDFVGQDFDVLLSYCESFKKEGEYPIIETFNSPLSVYKGYELNYENPYGAGRIKVK